MKYEVYIFLNLKIYFYFGMIPIGCNIHLKNLKILKKKLSDEVVADKTVFSHSNSQQNCYKWVPIDETGASAWEKIVITKM